MTGHDSKAGGMLNSNCTGSSIRIGTLNVQGPAFKLSTP